jgi:hypothetical protein
MGHEGLVLRQGVTFLRADASLLILGSFFFQTRKSTDVFGDSGKFIVIN